MWVVKYGLRMKKPSRFLTWANRHLNPRHRRRLTTRQRIVKWARWGVNNQSLIHYGQIRPYPKKLHLPMTTDCSGFVTLCYKMAGAPDPNGMHYDGAGFTGTLLSHAKHITTDLSKAKPGDLIVIGPGVGVHVMVVVEAGPNPLCVSHGREMDPRYERALNDLRTPKRVCSYL